MAYEIILYLSVDISNLLVLKKDSVHDSLKVLLKILNTLQAYIMNMDG